MSVTLERFLRSSDFARLPSMDVGGRLAAVLDALPGRAIFTTSFGMEDQILTHIICESGVNVELVTLDTGRLFPETYDVWARTEARYKRKVMPFFPDASEIAALYKSQGVNGFFDGVAERKACCHVRKVIPLGKALATADIWITGLRAEQAASRNNLPMLEQDDINGVIKFNPLLDWTKADMESFLEQTPKVPLNTLHKKGFPSIGCQPCTRAIMPGEDDRAGRWWWENDNQECGLHVGPDGRLTRSKP